MDNQFFRVAEEVDWDLERQIEVLDGFFSGFGVSATLDDYLAEHGLALGLRFHRAPLRDRMLAFVHKIGAQGALTRVLQRTLREAAELAARERVAAAGAAQEAERAPMRPARPRRSLLGWLRRRPAVPPPARLDSSPPA